MKPFALLFLGVVVGWAASGVDWSREAVGQEPAFDAEAVEGEALADEPAGVPGDRGERSIRRQGDGILRRRGILPPRETPSPADAPPYLPTSDAPAMPTGQPPYGPPDFDQINATAMRRSPAPAIAGLVGRFQVSAYGSPSGHGCYIVDTMTGQTWHAANGQPPQVVAESLHPQSTQPAMPVPAMLPTPSQPTPQTYAEPSPTLEQRIPPKLFDEPTPARND